MAAKNKFMNAMKMPAIADMFSVAEERESHEFILLDDAVGETLRTDKDHSHRLVIRQRRSAATSPKGRGKSGLRQWFCKFAVVVLSDAV